MDRYKVAHEAGMGSQPGLNLLSFMHLQIVHHQIHARLADGKLLLQLGEKPNEFDLPFARLGASVDLARSGIKRRKQVQGSCSCVLVLQTSWGAWASGKRGSRARARLEVGLLINTQDHFLSGHWSRVQLDQGVDQFGKVLITGNFC